MANVLVREETLQGIADKIRSDLGTDATYKPADMPSAVHSVYDKGVADGVESARPAMPILLDNFSDNTWEDIIWACQNNAVSSTWNVGDKKTLTFDMPYGTESVTIGICGKNVNTYADGGTAPLTFCNTNWFEKLYMCDKDSSYFGGFMENSLTDYLFFIGNENVKNAIRAVSRTAKLYTNEFANPLQITTAEKLFLFNKDEAPQRFANRGFLDGSSQEYWLRDQDEYRYSDDHFNCYWAMYTDVGDFYQVRDGYACTQSCNVLFGFCF